MADSDWISNNRRTRVRVTDRDDDKDRLAFETIEDGQAHEAASVADFLAEFYEDTAEERARRGVADGAPGGPVP
jgi:hypothetical protein